MVEASRAPTSALHPNAPYQSKTPLLSVHNVSKRFPGVLDNDVLANDKVSLDLYAGEVHALLGENGAGKTTLVSILYGLYRPDEGELALSGTPVTLRSPKDAIRSGIGLVAQHFLLVKRHTVAENIALGLAGAPFFFPARGLRKRIRDLGERYGLRVDPDAYVSELSAGEQQRVEILKALLRGAEVLILDEPTGVLTPGEAQGLFEVVRRMTREGHGVVFITHKLDEVMDVSDRITVLRKGAVVGTLGRAEATPQTLARLMVGREVVLGRVPLGRPSEVALEVRNLWVKSDRQTDALQDVSFTLRRGEILGVAGVAGNGQGELIGALTGHRHAEAGSVKLFGQEARGLSARELFERGVAHIPEERNGVGVVPALSVADNLALRHYRYRPFSRGPLLSRAAVSSFADDAIRDYNIATPSRSTPARLLSGGNIQKLILARELSERPSGEVRLVVAAHPTYGLDVGATEQTHRLLLAQRDRGAGVLLVSEDLEELFRLSDRIMVLFAGEVMGILDAESADRERVGLMMAGSGRA